MLIVTGAIKPVCFPFPNSRYSQKICAKTPKSAKHLQIVIEASLRNMAFVIQLGLISSRDFHRHHYYHHHHLYLNTVSQFIDEKQDAGPGTTLNSKCSLSSQT